MPLATLDPTGAVAREIVQLWWWMLVLGVVSFVIFAVLLGAALRGRGRTDDPAERDEGDAGVRGPWLVGAGVIQPVVLLAVTFALTLVAMRAIPDTAPSDALSVEITGHQWWYEVRYPDADVVSANELRIPVGTPVALTLGSSDVVHSFWVPQLAGKTDMLPDGPTTLVMQADEPGRYPGRCAEFCGLQHTRMTIDVIAEMPDDFEAWLSDQGQPAPPPDGEVAERGEAVFLGSNCAECHAISGTPADGRRGPDLTHLASRSTIGAGTVANTPEQLEAWIRDPHDVKEGVDMPPSPLDGEDLEALITYLAGLE